jgi:hypothetical protein
MAVTVKRGAFKLVALTGYVVFVGSVHCSATADELGRLFTTPKERAVLNTLREHYDPKRQDHIEVQQPKIPVETPNQLELNGVVERSDGKNTAWVNGKNTINKKQKGIHINSHNMSANNVQIRITNPNRSVTMKPGEIYNPESGRIQDSYKAQEQRPNEQASCISIRSAEHNIELRCK